MTAASSLEEEPVHLIQWAGTPVALMKASGFAALPFSCRQCEITPLPAGANITAYITTLQERSWVVHVKVQCSLLSTEGRHWAVLTSQGQHATNILSTPFTFTEMPVASLEKQLSELQLKGSYHLYLVSELQADSVPVVSHTLKDAGASDPMYICGERIILGDGGADIAAAVSDLLRNFQEDQMVSCTAVFWPSTLCVPVNIQSLCSPRRRTEHDALLLPCQPLLRWELRAINWKTLDDLLSRCRSSNQSHRKGASWEAHLLSNVHLDVKRGPSPSIEGSCTCLVTGSYDYYHYRVDGFKDDGWGCAYRSLQTILSWFQHANILASSIPSILEIQQILFAADPDKASKTHFVGSKEWIGSIEIMLVLQHYMPDLECTIKRMESGDQLDTDPGVQALLLHHFQQASACPVMIGGHSYAHTILGVCMNPNTMEAQYLVLDPHYSANPSNLQTAVKKGFVGWKQAKSYFEAGSWYNICIPCVASYDPR